MRSKPVIRMILTSDGLAEASRNSQPADSASAGYAWPAEVILCICGRIKGYA